MPAARRPALPIYVATGAFFAALAVRNFVVPLRVHEVGGDRLTVGLLFTVFTVFAAGLSLPAGLLADRLGRRELVLFSAVTGAVSQLGMAAATSTAPMFAWQALAGLGGGAAQAALFAALADTVRGPRLGQAMGWLTLSMQVGFLGGPALAGLTAAWLGLQTALAASAALFAVTAAMTLVGVRAVPRSKASWDLAGPLRQVAAGPGFAAASLGLLGATLMWGTLQAYLPLFGREQLGLPVAQVGYLIAIQAVANGLSRIPGGRLVDRSRRRGPIVVGGLALYALSMALLPHAAGFWPTAALLALSVPLVATVYIALSVVFTNLTGPAMRGMAMGVYGLVLYIGMGAGPAVFGTVMERSGYVAGFTACAAAGLALAGTVAVLRTEPLRRRLSAPASSAGS